MRDVMNFARPCSSVPTEAESRLALESSRRLNLTLLNDPAPMAELVVKNPTGPASEPMEIPASALRLLGVIMTEMAKGNAITLTSIQAELTSKQAADLLNVSRPYLCKLLDTGEIPHRKVGRHRRVKFSDLMDYKARNQEARSQALDELVVQAQELGMGY